MVGGAETITHTESLTRRVVGISQMAVSTDPGELLVTYSLGSCVGVTIYDPRARVGGLVHCLLPLSRQEPEKAKKNPAMFTDSGVVALIQGVLDAGASRENLHVKVAGGASPLDTCGRFKIGERNVTVLRKVLWKNDLMLAAEDVGGTQPRTLSLYMDRGRCTVRTAGQEVDL